MTYKASARARVIAENAGPISSGVRTPTKLSSIDSEGAAALRSSITFGWYGVVWIPQDCDPGEPWDRLLEQLQLLGGEVGNHQREPGDVSARMREVCDQAGSDWIGDKRP